MVKFVAIKFGLLKSCYATDSQAVAEAASVWDAMAKRGVVMWGGVTDNWELVDVVIESHGEDQTRLGASFSFCSLLNNFHCPFFLHTGCRKRTNV